MFGGVGVVKPRSVAVFVSGCVSVFLLGGSFKASTVFVDEAISDYQSNYFLVGSTYVAQPAVSFIVAGIGGSILEGVSLRFMGTIGGALFGAGFIYQGLFGYQLFQLFEATLISAVGGGLLHFATYISYLEHFKTKFAVALAGKELCTYLGVSIVPPVVEELSSAYGLHGAYLVMGALACNCIICGILLRPAAGGGARDREGRISTGPSVRGWSCCRGCSKSEDPPNSEDGLCSSSSLSSIFDISPVTQHGQFAVFLVIHSLFYYTFTAWAIFLVPFGTSIGLVPSRAVKLSTAGGVGGVLGKILVSAIFHLDGMDVVLAGVVPSCVICVGLVGYLLSSSYALLLLSSFLCGLGLAFADTAQSGMLPRFLCDHHVRQGSAIGYLGGGLFMQLGGCVSGLLLDGTSSYNWLFGVMAAVNVVICVGCAVLYNMDTAITECNDRSRNADNELTSKS